MPAIARVGDGVLSQDGTGYKCRQPMKTACGGTIGNTKVFAQNILVVVRGDPVAPHPRSGCVPDESTLTQVSSKVFACGKGVGRIGDEYGGINTITRGSSKVFAGG